MTEPEVIHFDAMLSKCQTILSSGFWDRTTFKNWQFEACFTLLMINLHDAFQFAARHGHRVQVDAPTGEGDVVDLVSKFRNACCHIGSKNKLIDTNIFAFQIVIGQGVPFVMNGRPLTSDYEDDVAIYCGEFKIYIEHHILEALYKSIALLLTNAEAVNLPRHVIDHVLQTRFDERIRVRNPVAPSSPPRKGRGGRKSRV